MAQYRSFRDLDWALIIISIAICGIGVLQIFSATHDTPTWSDAWWKQIVYICAGIVLLWAVSKIDYHTLLGQAPLLYVLTILALLGTFAVGKMVFGSRRWIGIGGFHLQVSEFAKLVIVLLVARYLSGVKGEQLEVRDLVRLGGLVGLPLLLVLAQPDLGTSLTYLPILAVGVFLAGVRWKYVLTIAVGIGLMLPVGWHFLKDYQKARLVSFLDPSQDPKGSGYQVIQSKIAVGQGGMWGRGVTRGTQTQLRFLPVPHTDFIFSAFAEEHGFVGIVVVLGLYFLLLMQIVQNAQTSPDRAGMYICMGVAALLLFHLLVNVGMVVGRMPVTGIPLPLMSAGGSNILSMFLMLGLVNNVRLRRFVN
ncbi:MAG TPA: rod shape-determining protein RodA [Bryobacteraceae bacterium]|jgi:rod shape determining protein RodA|nr:rod shape-determining protein RodA [Bryobacteraceae bacterium]